jgi:hypothetical protein
MGLDVDSSGSELRPMAEFGIRDIDISDSDTRELVSIVDTNYQTV